MAIRLTAKQQEELARQARFELCRRNFWYFCQYMYPEFFTDDKEHLKIIAEALQDVTEGNCKKLAISLPPRAGKSFIISNWCAWALGKNPKGSIMRNSYSAELAEEFSYFIRDLIQTEKYRNVFPDVKLKGDRSRVEGWMLEGAGRASYFCAGVGGSITGKGCTIAGILDDPLKNIEEALSETIIDKVWNWYTSTHLSRFESGCPEIHIATRWSKRDPIGRLTDPYSEYYTDDWKVIVVPALDENGKSFCESVKTTEEYHQIKKVTPDFIWEAEYMQNPIESKGLLFPIEDLNRFSMKELAGKEPDGIFGFTDTADEGTDYLCSIIGKMYGNRIYITDVIFNQDPIEVTQPEVAGMIINTECELMKIESNNGGKGYAREIRRLIEGKSTCGIIYEPTTKNKETRILMNSGNIKNYFWFRNDYEPGSQYDSYMRALTSYVRLGKNKHDDAPDATTALWEYTKDYITTDKYKSIRRKAINRFDEDLYDDEEEEFSMYTI